MSDENIDFGNNEKHDSDKNSEFNIKTNDEQFNSICEKIKAIDELNIHNDKKLELKNILIKSLDLNLTTSSRIIDLIAQENLSYSEFKTINTHNILRLLDNSITDLREPYRYIKLFEEVYSLMQFIKCNENYIEEHSDDNIVEQAQSVIDELDNIRYEIFDAYSSESIPSAGIISDLSKALSIAKSTLRTCFTVDDIITLFFENTSIYENLLNETDKNDKDEEDEDDLE